MFIIISTRRKAFLDPKKAVKRGEKRILFLPNKHEGFFIFCPHSLFKFRFVHPFFYKKHIQFKKIFLRSKIFLAVFKKSFFSSWIGFFQLPTPLKSWFFKRSKMKKKKKPFFLLNINKNSFFLPIYCFLRSEKEFDS